MGVTDLTALPVNTKQKMMDDSSSAGLYTVFYYKPTINNAGGNNS